MSAQAPTDAPPREGRFHSPLGLHDYQADDVAHAYLMADAMLVWDTGVGKANKCSEPLLTPHGWTLMGDIEVGDEVIGPDGLPTPVVAVHPQGEQDTYRVTFSDGTWSECNLDHLWTVTYWGSSRASGKQVRVERTTTISTRELLRRGVKTPKGRRKFRIPMVAPVQFEPRDLPVDPYTLGVILGDGHIRPDGEVRFTAEAECLTRIGLTDLHDHPSPGIATKSSTQWRDDLISLELAGTKSDSKFVPEDYLWSSEADRRALLAGLVDTDGHALPSGGVEFTSTSQHLAEAVVHLVQSLGGTAGSTWEQPREAHYLDDDGERVECKPYWRVTFRLLDQPFRLERKAQQWVRPTKYLPHRHIESIERVGRDEHQCITVGREDGLYVTRSFIVTHNSVAGCALSALLREDDEVDLVFVISERNKVPEWLEDVEFFTDLSVEKYHGSPKRRERLRGLLGTEDSPEVLTSTYETVKNDAAVFFKNKRKHPVPGPLLETILEHGLRVLIVYDESTKLKGRTSANHRAHKMLVDTLREQTACRVVMLTATPVERDIEDTYNQMRILVPDGLMSVKEFNRRYVSSRDIFDKPTFQHIERDTLYERMAPGYPPFVDVIRPWMLRRRKTDPDVREQFPERVEEALWVPTPKKVRDFIRDVEAALGERARTEMEERAIFGVLRLIAGHPMSLLRASGGNAKLIVDEVGPEALEAFGAPKVERLLEHFEVVVKGQGAKSVLFTFFSKSVLPLLQIALEAEGYSVAPYHGSMSPSVADANLARFKDPDGGVDILLSSDKGKRGLNLPMADYITHFELPLLYSDYEQRMNRNHRSGMDKELVTSTAMIADDTVEVAIANLVLRRNEVSDIIRGDVGAVDFLSAEERRALIEMGRPQR